MEWNFDVLADKQKSHCSKETLNWELKTKTWHA